MFVASFVIVSKSTSDIVTVMGVMLFLASTCIFVAMSGAYIRRKFKGISAENQKGEVSSNKTHQTVKLLPTNAAMVIVVVLVGTFVVAAFNSEPPPSTAKPTMQRIIMQETSLNDEQTAILVAILDKSGVGIKEIESIRYFDKLDNGKKIYELSTKISPLMITLNTDGTVSEIHVKMRDIQLYGNGETMYVFLNNEEVGRYKAESKSLIKKLLKSPDSAKFPGFLDSEGWRVWQEKETVYVQSYVDATNSFNAKIRSDFQIKYKNGRPISLIMNGKEYLK